MMIQMFSKNITNYVVWGIIVLYWLKFYFKELQDFK